MPAKTIDQIRSEITLSLQNQNLNLLVNSLADANAKIAELEEKLAAATKKES